MRTSEFPPSILFKITPEKVPTPKLIQRNQSIQGHKGQYEIAYTLIDKNNRMTEKSPSTIINPSKDGWIICADIDIDKNTEAVAVMYWVRRISPYVLYPQENEWRPLGSQGGKSSQQDTVYPYTTIGCYSNNWFGGHTIEKSVFPYLGQVWFNFDNPFWRKGSYLSTPTSAPIVKVFHIPNYNFEMCYSYAGEIGETLSTIIDIPSHAVCPDPEYCCTITIDKNHVNLFNGIRGCYVYLRVKGTTQWHRQKPSRMTNYEYDEYLWPITDNKFVIFNYEENNISPSSQLGASNLSDLHQACQYDNGNIIVDTKPIISVPVIMPLNNPKGTCYKRTISAENGGQWTLITSPNYASHSVWIENANTTRLVGATIVSDRAENGICFTDTNNGGAFHFRSERLDISLSKGGYTCGIAQYWGGVALRDSHSCSEPIFTDTGIGAKFPVVIEGNQSLNWVFQNFTATGRNNNSAIVTIDNYGSVIFRGRFLCEEARTIVACNNASYIFIENVFIDAGIPEYFNIHGTMPTVIEAEFINSNHRISQLLLVNCPNQGVALVEANIKFRKATNQYKDVNNNILPISTVAFTPRYNGIILDCQSIKSFISDIKMYRPTLTFWKNLTYIDIKTKQTVQYWVVWDNSVTYSKSNLLPIKYNNTSTDTVKVYAW